jgi:hypothetical protein
MSDGQRLTDIIKVVNVRFSDRCITFHGLNRGNHFMPKSADRGKPAILVFDFTLTDLKGEPTEAMLLYYEVDGERFYIDENTVSPATTLPTSEAVKCFRKIHGIVVDDE